jgi:hypothetical protein
LTESFEQQNRQLDLEFLRQEEAIRVQEAEEDRADALRENQQSNDSMEEDDYDMMLDDTAVVNEDPEMTPSATTTPPDTSADGE